MPRDGFSPDVDADAVALPSQIRSVSALAIKPPRRAAHRCDLNEIPTSKSILFRNFHVFNRFVHRTRSRPLSR